MDNLIYIIIIALIVVIYLSIKICTKGLRQTTIDLIVEAEKTLDNNEEKFKMVVGGILAFLPYPLDKIPVSIIESLVQKTFDSIKEALDYRGDK